ncbi:hypothetical protein [Cryobacterium psychrophilum]|uniref:Uncharacterized protein n=1 Tax=Cryobacterium psychrophilum TaxID=41988 RepID=A0A4Y8KWS3_9MICO|nr:hypothetical protein [Cryobacterium psychrophilum]TDW28787.1 hypothetical protein EDD25_0422 [Cryobacterium psychrophilum]TFD82435.1 hypothetical protein E3T53_00765 [Cryobacterium psychrophilum]
MVAGAGDIVKKILGAILIGIVALAVAASILVRSIEDRVTEELVVQVSRLAIPADWKVLDDIVRREQFLCVSTNPCPSISRRWEAQAGEVVTAEDLVQTAAAADVTLTVDRLCERPANNGGRAIMCIGRGVEDGYDYQLSLSSAAPGEPLQVSLYVSPATTA